MYLIDTNIFLEILQEQEKCEECEILINKISKSDVLFHVSSFTLHSIEVIMTNSKKIEELRDFLYDIITSKIVRIETNTNDELKTLKTMKRLNLDFDDAMQAYLCEGYNLKIISYDKHFDKTPIKRLEPSDLK